MVSAGEERAPCRGENDQSEFQIKRLDGNWSTNDASPTELSTRRARAIDEQQPSPKQFKNATEKTPGGARATTAYRADAVHTTPSVR